MNFADELIGLLERVAAKAPPPKVRALHLPPMGQPVTKEGEFCALELADGSMGLSYVLLDDTLGQLTALGSGALAGADALELARRFATGRGPERTLGFAAANALTRFFFDRAGFSPDDSADSVGMMAPAAADHVGMIGLFCRLVPRITGAGARLTVVELQPELAGDFDGYRVTLAAEDLSGCNKVLSTSTILLNDTLDRMLASSAGAGYFAMVGPGAGCLPDPLFARGVTMLGGAWVEDAAGFREALKAGESWGEHARKFALGREAYPGFEALAGRL